MHVHIYVSIDNCYRSIFLHLSQTVVFTYIYIYMYRSVELSRIVVERLLYRILNFKPGSIFALNLVKSFSLHF